LKNLEIIFIFTLYNSDRPFQMTFRTELNLNPSPFNISHQHSILMLGSCFTSHIGDRLQKYKFNCISNPFGTIFHPVAIAKTIAYILEGRPIDPSDLILSQGLMVHPDFHSSLAGTSVVISQEKMNTAIDHTHQLVRQLDYLFITLGTSIGYRSLKNGKIVANCHKIPASAFTKETTSIETIVNELQKVFSHLHNVNQTIKIILTVSPVRHIKDGLIANSRSKAQLILACEQLCQTLPFVSYFPAYEWLMDDLRDYRFFEADLIHPNTQAVDYVWQKFSDHYFDNTTHEINRRIEKINKSLEHRPFNPDSKEHHTFVNNTEKEIQLLSKEYPWMKF